VNVAEAEIVLESQGLTKRYGDFLAVDDLALTVLRGEVMGLLGPNGSGKTTTILMLLGLTEATAGTVRVLGFDPARQPLSVKARVGYLPEQVGFYDNLTARENLIYIAKLNGLRRAELHERVEKVLVQMGLGEVADQRVRTFSRGMRQRLGVADVLVKEPELIIMDEPTVGLDPTAAHEFLETVRRLKARGITILLCSHLLHQVQAICDRVGLFHRGRMVLHGTVGELAQRVLGGAYRIRVEAQGASSVEASLRGLKEVVKVTRSAPDVYELEAEKDVRASAARAVIEGGGTLLGLDARAPDLDEIYERYFEQEVDHAAAA
jgi:ABC-2 type transport system ATP-binding protein